MNCNSTQVVGSLLILTWHLLTLTSNAVLRYVNLTCRLCKCVMLCCSISCWLASSSSSVFRLMSSARSVANIISSDAASACGQAINDDIVCQPELGMCRASQSLPSELLLSHTVVAKGVHKKVQTYGHRKTLRGILNKPWVCKPEQVTYAFPRAKANERTSVASLGGQRHHQLYASC